MSGDILTIPIDVVGEQVLIAAAVVSDERRAGLVRRVSVDQVQHPKHRPIWECMHELVRRNLAWDPSTVQSLFGDKVDIAYIDTLTESMPGVPIDLDHHVDRVLWDSARANAGRGALPALLEALKDPHASPERVRALGRQLAEALGEYRDRRFLRDPSAVVRELSEELTKRRGGIAVYPYGIRGLDVDESGAQRLVPGAKPARVTVITGTSGGAKSTIACRIALGQSRLRRRVLYGAWEMGATESVELLSLMSLAEQPFEQHHVNVSRRAFTTGKFTEDEQRLVEKRADQIGRYVRFFDNPFGRLRGEKKDVHSNDRNLDLVHQMIADTGADVFIADLWERCLRDTDPEEEKHGLFRMQAIAEETKCHVILLAQQRLKDIEQRPDKHPTRDGIKGSSAWVDIADTILGMYRPAQWKAVPDEVVHVDLLKQRYGPWPIRVELEWAPDCGWFGKGTTIPFERDVPQAEGGEFDAFASPDGAPPPRKPRRR